VLGASGTCLAPTETECRRGADDGHSITTKPLYWGF